MSIRDSVLILINEYLSKGSDKELFDSSLLTEMKNFGESMTQTIIKEKEGRVYIKCLKANKINLANRIRKKYKLFFDDMTMAFLLSLNAVNQLNKNK